MTTALGLALGEGGSWVGVDRGVGVRTPRVGSALAGAVPAIVDGETGFAARPPCPPAEVEWAQAASGTDTIRAPRLAATIR